MKVEIPNSILITLSGQTSRGVKGIEVREADGHLIFTLTDGKELDMGSVMGPQGDPGATGPQGPAGKTPVKGTDYFTAADKSEIAEDAAALVTVPTKVSELTNDANYITADQAPVKSVNGKTGNVTVSTTFVAYRLGNSSATCTFAEMLEAWKRGDICILRYGADGMLEYQLFAVVDNESITFTYVDGNIIREIVWTADGNFTDNNKDLTKELPTVTTADNGKFLRVVSGAWAAAEIANANGGSF